MTRATRLAVVIGALAFAYPGLALARPRWMGAGGRPAFLDELFPPRLVMAHQDDIALTADQRAAITQAITATQSRLTDLQWQLEAASTALTKIVATSSVDEAAALTAAERAMAVEQEMKKAHLALLIQIKNQLDPAQQAKLRALRGPEGWLGPGPSASPDAGAD